LFNFSPSWHLNFFFSSSSLGNILISLTLSLHRIQYFGGGRGEGLIQCFGCPFECHVHFIFSPFFIHRFQYIGSNFFSLFN
jgi:hypothetical protein